MAQFPLLKGRRTSKSSRYLDALPVNMIPVPGEAPNASGYLRSFKGIEHLYDCDGVSYSALYNDLEGAEYRILGTKLYRDGVSSGNLSSPTIANMAHSRTSTAFVDDGKLKYYRDGNITELLNWTEGENFTSYPDWKFTPDFNGTTFVDIWPVWDATGPMGIKFVAILDSLPATDMWILSSSRLDGIKAGVFYKGSDTSFYYTLDGVAEVKVKSAIVGENFVEISTDAPFDYKLQIVGAARYQLDPSDYFLGKIYNLELSDNSNPAINRAYSMILEEARVDGERPPTPTTTVVKNDINNNLPAELRGTWTDFPTQGDPTFSAATSYDLSGVIDMDRHQGRYVWINKQRFGCTALTIGEGGDPDTSPEQRPDYVAPFYSPESDPDNNMAIRSYLGNYVVVFGRSTTEFFRLTGNADIIYAPQKNMETQAGIVATGAVCYYEGAFAAIGNEKGDSLGVIVIAPNKSQKISTATIDGVLATYKESELKDALIESMSMDNHSLLFVHLPNHTFVFDSSSQLWFTLKSDIEGELPYTGRHIVYNHENGLTIGDRNQGRVGLLTDDVSSQYDDVVECILYTPFVKISAGRGAVPLYNLGFDSIYGESSVAQSVMISATLDGRTYGNEFYYTFNEPKEYLNKTLISNVGACYDSIGFKLRLVTKDNVNISGFNIGIGNGG